MNKNITVYNRTEAASSKWGMDGAGITWKSEGVFWAGVDWAKGKQAMNVGALDAYACILVRMRYTDKVNMRSRIVWDNVTYQIIPETFHPDYRENTIQFNAQAIIGESEMAIVPEPEPEPEPQNDTA